MMQENKRASKPRMRVLALVPAALVAVALAVNPAVASEASALTPKPATAPAPAAVVAQVSVPAAIPAVATEAIAVPRAQQPDMKSEAKRVIVENPEVVPAFPGGETELYKWLSRNIRYPEAAMKNNEQGRVTVQFVVNEDGSVSDAKIIRGVSQEIDAEALRVVGTLPKFTPGTVKGKPTACWFTLPIMFKLQQEKAPANAEPKSEVKEIPAGSVVKGPTFPGGEAELYKYISRKLRYPEAAVKSNTQGRVIVQFLVNADGSVSDPKVVRGVSEELDAEALRVIGELPEFTPGTMDGKPVGSWYALPIMFKLASDTPAEEKKN